MALNAIVRTNITAVNAHRQLSGAGIQQKSAAQKLSSGRRINTAADDVAGMGIAEKMRAQVFSLDRASLNAQDAMSLIQTADGALSSVNEMLIRVRELVVKAANDTNVHDELMLMQSDRRAIQDEIEQLMFEINNVAYRTEFNTRTLFDGSLHADGVLEGSHQWVEKVQTNAPASITTLDQFLRFPATQPFEGSLERLLMAVGANLESKTAADWIAVHAGASWEGLEAALDIAMGVDPAHAGDHSAVIISGQGGRWEQLEAASNLTFRSARELLDAFVEGLHNPNVLRGGDIPWNAPQMPFTDWEEFLVQANSDLSASTFARQVSTTGGMTIYQALIRGIDATPSHIGDLHEDSTFSDVRNLLYRMNGNPAGGWGTGLDDIEEYLVHWLNAHYGDRFGDPIDSLAAWKQFRNDYLTANTEIVEHRVWVPNEEERRHGVALWFQTGANSGQGMTVGIRAMSTRALGQPRGDLMDMIDVENPRGRPISDQLDFLDSALTHVNRQRAELGAVYNRLEFVRLGLDVTSENLTTAMSRIRDADMAKEMMNFYQANIMTQAATAMIAHANQAPQTVLELLQ